MSTQTNMELEAKRPLDKDVALCSIAISLKRIADALDPERIDKAIKLAVFHALESSRAQR